MTHATRFVRLAAIVLIAMINLTAALATEQTCPDAAEAPRNTQKRAELQVKLVEIRRAITVLERLLRAGGPDLEGLLSWANARSVDADDALSGGGKGILSSGGRRSAFSEHREPRLRELWTLLAELELRRADLEAHIASMPEDGSIPSTLEDPRIRTADISLSTPGESEDASFECGSESHESARIGPSAVDLSLAVYTLRSELRNLDRKVREEVERRSDAAGVTSRRSIRTTTKAAGTGHISGTVTDASTSSPIQDVEVDIYDDTGTWADYGYTDASGNYTTFNGLGTGTYYAVTWNFAGYYDELYDDLPCSDHACDVMTGTPISVTDGSTTTGIDFALDQPGSASGTVIDASTTAPIASVRVDFFDAGGAYIRSDWTDASGNYTAVDLTAGTYYALTWNSAGYVDEVYNDFPCIGGTCDVTTGTAIPVTSGSTTTGIDFALEQGGSISGTVTDASLSAIPGVEVDIYDAGGNYLTSGWTDGSGNYMPPALPPGAYHAVTINASGFLDELYDNMPCYSGTCEVTTGTPIPVVGGSTTSGVDFELDPGGSISGTVTDAVTTAPIASVSVRVYDASGNLLTSAWTDATGSYTTSSVLPTGTFFATTWNYAGYLDELFDNLPCYGGSCDATAGTAIPVTAGSSTGAIDFALSPGGSISGTVTDASTTSALAGVYVYVYNAGGGYVVSSTTDASGNYQTASKLPPGDYYAVTKNPGSYVDEVYDDVPCVGNCDVTTGSAIPVVAAATTGGVDFALDQGGSVSGTVTDASTTSPIANVYVYFYDADGTYMARGLTDGSGAYTTSPGLLTGTYYARTWNSASYLNEVWNDLPCFDSTCDPTSGGAISVTLGAETSGIDFALEPGGSISGTLTDAATSAPIQYAEVSVFDSAGTYMSSTSTDAFGDYTTLAGLPTGNYHALTTNYDRYLDELYDDILCFDYSCDVTTGTMIPVTVGSSTGGIDFALDKGGAISGIVTNAATSSPIGGVSVRVYDDTGIVVSGGYTNSSGSYLTFIGLPTGTYYAATAVTAGFVDELYDNLPCADGTCNATDATTGTSISVAAGSTTAGVNFALEPEAGTGGSIAGTVTDASTAAPIQNVEVQVFDAGGSLAGSALTDASGNFSVSGLPAGTCYARTANSAGYMDERFDNLTCAGSCDILMGTAIPVTDGVTTPNIDFDLYLDGTDPTLVLSHEVISSSGTFQACTSITATDLQIRAPAVVEFTSGSEIVLGSGFSVEPGARFIAGTDPAMVCP